MYVTKIKMSTIAESLSVIANNKESNISEHCELLWC